MISDLKGRSLNETRTINLSLGDNILDSRGQTATNQSSLLGQASEQLDAASWA